MIFAKILTLLPVVGAGVGAMLFAILVSRVFHRITGIRHSIMHEVLICGHAVIAMFIVPSLGIPFDA